MNLVDSLYWITGAFKGTLNWSPTANRTITLPDDSVTLLGDDRPIGSAGAGVSVRGYLPIVAVSASKTLALSDGSTTQICTATATITIPLNATVPFPIGTEIPIVRSTTGTVTLVLTSGVTVTNRDGNTNTLTQITNYATLKKTGTNAWIAINPVPNNAYLPGTPACDTPEPGTNSTRIANTAYVQNAVTIAGSIVNPVGVSIVDWSIPAGVRRLTLFSSGLQSPDGGLVRLGTSGGFLTTGYYSAAIFTGFGTGAYPGNTTGLIVPECSAATVFCMTFYRGASSDWISTGQSNYSQTSQYLVFSAGSIQLPGELTTFRYVSQSIMNSGSLQLLWEF